MRPKSSLMMIPKSSLTTPVNFLCGLPLFLLTCSFVLQDSAGGGSTVNTDHLLLKIRHWCVIFPLYSQCHKHLKVRGSQRHTDTSLSTDLHWFFCFLVHTNSFKSHTWETTLLMLPADIIMWTSSCINQDTDNTYTVTPLWLHWRHLWANDPLSHKIFRNSC